MAGLVDRFPVVGTCDICPETTMVLTKYKGKYYCRLCLAEEKEKEYDRKVRKKREKAAGNFRRWNE